MPPPCLPPGPPGPPGRPSPGPGGSEKAPSTRSKTTSSTMASSLALTGPVTRATSSSTIRSAASSMIRLTAWRSAAVSAAPRTADRPPVTTASPTEMPNEAAIAPSSISALVFIPKTTSATTSHASANSRAISGIFSRCPALTCDQCFSIASTAQPCEDDRIRDTAWCASPPWPSNLSAKSRMASAISR